jgi:two-component system cell cycle sensor histidine kinase/response regulator CckA
VFPAELTVTEFSLEGERRFTGVLRDITERQRLQSQFIQAQKMEAVGRLAGGVAHDFNNLLTIISGYCELLMMSDIPAGDKRRESIATIRDAGERAARLTQQLLAFSRKSIIEPKLIDLNALVADSAKLLRRLIGEDIILAVVTAPRPIPIKVDPGQLEQVIMNLVVNARDAMPTGGRLTIETSTVESGEGAASQLARLAVRDTGHGMSDEVKEKIFEPFFTTKGVGMGTGLGLAVVHGVVTQSGGHVVIQSEVGVGTTFQILLPLVIDPPPKAFVDSNRYASRGTETVLLVEDDKAVRTITRISLQSQGYTVVEASDGLAGLQQAETYPGEIHLLISDVVMPEMGGRQLLTEVRKHRPDLRVLFMSGYTDDAVLLHGVVEATDAFIQKPFTPLSLARKVREVIDAPRS